MKIVGYFLSNNLDSERELEDIRWAKSAVDKLVVVTSTDISVPGLGVKYLRLRYLKKYKHILKIWASFSYLVSRLANSKTDIFFPDRNVYSKSKFATNLVNFLWGFKMVESVARLLPNFEKIFLLFWTSKKSKRRNRAIFYNSLLIHLGELVAFLGAYKNSNICKVAILKSWDNPFYTQFSSRADCYVVWSKSMWEDVVNTHNIGTKNHIIYGPRPYKNFIQNNLGRILNTHNIKDIIMRFGYACAYGDEFLAKYEISLIKLMSEELKSYNSNAILYIRPYPTMRKGEYQELAYCGNIEIIEIEDDFYCEFGGRRKGDEYEKKEFLNLFDVFISLGTSFTIEAEIVGVPIVQYYKKKNNRKKDCEIEVFRRIDVCDHILKYFLENLETLETLKSIGEFRKNKNNLTEKLGLAFEFDSDNSSTKMKEYIKCTISED